MPTYDNIPMSCIMYSMDNIGRNLQCFLWVTLCMKSYKQLPGKKEELTTLTESPKVYSY